MSATDTSFTIGKAAHIKAAAAGGPRYDPTQTSAERRSIHNGIWLCASCGDIIDRDEAEYPVETLHQLKTAAEQLARNRVGRRPQSGPPVPKTHTDIRQAIELFCLSEAARCARLDARFNVSVGWANDAPVYELHAKEPVPATFAIGTKDAERFSSEFKRFHEYGGTLEFENIDFSMKGSPLFPGGDVACTRLQLRACARC